MKKIIMSVGLVLGALNSVGMSEAQSATEVQAKLQEVLRTPVKQQKIADCNFQSSAPVSFGTGAMVMDPSGRVTLSGVDRQGKTWTATYEDVAPAAGCELWQAYLGNDGEVDLIFVQNGFDSSGGWDTVLSLLLFDDQGRPFPWQAMAKFTVNDTGIRELVQFEGEKKSIVIVPQRKDTDRSNGYYSYHAYEIAGTRVAEMVGTYDGVTWPLYDYAAPSQGPNVATVQTLTTAEKLTGDDAIPSTSLIYQGTIGAAGSERRLVMSNTSFPLPDALVIDGATGRRIVTSPTNSDLVELQANHAKGIVLGNNCTGRACHPLLIWLKQ